VGNVLQESRLADVCKGVKPLIDAIAACILKTGNIIPEGSALKVNQRYGHGGAPTFKNLER
jgi:hypothetical protein